MEKRRRARQQFFIGGADQKKIRSDQKHIYTQKKPLRKMHDYQGREKLMMSSSSSSQKQQMRGNGGSCEDCGNKAKRDCEHMRCRTCCKSRGLPCPTHVRSTWIPAAHRRRLLHHHLSLSAPSSAFPRLLTTGLQERNMNQGFPAEVTAVANFRCVRVSSDDNAVDQAAYQTSVNIGGHSFNGILYDQGPSSSGAAQIASAHQYPHRHHHHHHPGGDAGGSTSGGGFMPPPPFNPFLPNAAGMQFFFQPKP
ncbi:hypothetical protein V2J09_016789 [Rumex salicifolius]